MQNNLMLTSLGAKFSFEGFPSCRYAYQVVWGEQQWEIYIECGPKGYLGWVKGDPDFIVLPYKSFTCMSEAINIICTAKNLLSLK